MALIKCTECGKEFSDKAANCPHCGCPIEDVKSAMAEQEQLKEQKKAEQEQIKERKKAEKENKPKKELTPEQKKKYTIIGSVAAVIVILVAVLGWYYGIKIPRDKAYAHYVEVSESYSTAIDSYNQAVDTYNTIANQIIDLNETYSEVIEQAQAVIDSGEIPYEEETMTTLSDTLKVARDDKVETPSLYEKKDSHIVDENLSKSSAKKIEETITSIDADASELDSKTKEINAAGEKLVVPEYDSTLATIEEQQQALSDSYEIQKQITNPTEDWVVDRLQNVENIANIACATEENDPNGHLGKDGGYTAQIYYSSPLRGTSSVAGDRLIDAGTDAGGSIEIYETVEDAEKRNTYLASYDGTIFDSGKHMVLGTMVVRVSSKLTASKQEEFINEIVAALIELQ